MAELFTVDASVFLNAFHRHEPGHEISAAVLLRLQQHSVPLIVPTLLLPEVAGVISRIKNDTALALEFARILGKLPHMTFIDLDSVLAAQAMEVAAQYRLRGADAVYVALAQRFGAGLITLDREQHDRALGIIPTFYPTDLAE